MSGIYDAETACRGLIGWLIRLPITTGAAGLIHGFVREGMLGGGPVQNLGFCLEANEAG